MLDMMNQIHLARALSPVASAADNTPLVCQSIDRLAGIGYESVTYGILTGAIPDADATFVALLEHADDNGSGAPGTYVAVPDNQLVGTEVLASFKFDDDNKCFKIGYIGGKQWSRLTLTPANNTGSTLLAVVAIMGNPRATPTLNPPV